jgi:hypothetical protein
MRRLMLIAVVVACSLADGGIAEVYFPRPIPTPSPFPANSVVSQWYYACPNIQGTGCALRFGVTSSTELLSCTKGCVEATVYLLVVNQHGQSVRAFAATGTFLEANTGKQYALFAYTENQREFHWSVDGMNLVYGPNAP